MAILSNINDLFRVKSDGAIEFGTSGAGTATYVLTSAGANATPTWTEPTTGTVTSIELNADSGNAGATAITTSGIFTFTGGDNITTSVSGKIITIDADLSGTVTGTGTGQKVPKWNGTGTGKSELTDGPITFVTDDSTFTGNIYGNSSGTTEIGKFDTSVSPTVTNGIKRIKMVQGGELHFGDTTVLAPLGITEGDWDSFGDHDRISIYGRSSIKLYSGATASSGMLRLTLTTTSAFKGALSCDSTISGASVEATGNITTDGIFKVDFAPDNNILEVDQSGRKMALKTSFAANTTDSFWALKVSTGNTDGTMTDALVVKPLEGTFAGKAFSSATSSGDGTSTLTTKGYVDGLITGATIYRGTWDPDVSLNSGYGNPDLSGVTQTSGYYYICSADGVATPNGTGNEPNSWNTGDWVIWNDDVGSGEWQKIDNSSVLSGVGTGQTVALWQGASSVTDSETLGNAPITVSGNNSTFAGSVTAVGVSSTIGSATSGYFATSTAIPADQILHVRDNVAALATNSAGGIKISSAPGNDVFLLKRNSGGSSFFALQNSSATEFITVDMSAGETTFSKNVTFGGSVTAQGISATSLTTPTIQLQGDLNVLNKAQTSYITLADRDTTGSEVVYNLANVGSATFAGNISFPNSDLSSTAPPTNFGVYTSEVKLINTPNGGLQKCRVITDNYGEWILVGRFAESAMNTIANAATWSSVSGLSLGTTQTETTEFSADFGDSFPEEVRIMGATDFTKWRDTRTVDFVYKVPEGRKWKFFFSGGATNGMTSVGPNHSGNNKFGWNINGSYDGFGRWANPLQTSVGMSDANVTNPSAAYTTATTNAFAWDNADDAKITVTATRTFSGQDSFETAGFGNDDNIYGFFDEYPGETNNMQGGVDFSSAAWVLIKLPEGASGSGGSGTNYWAANGNDIYNVNTANVGVGTDSPGTLLQVGDTPTSGGSPFSAYGFDGAAQLFTTRAESNFNTALYLYNNPVGESGTGTGIMLRARSSTTDSQQQATVYSSWTTNTHATRTAKLVFQTANSGVVSDKMTILGNGNVGIGATDPSAQLNVVGTGNGVGIRISGDPSAGGAYYYGIMHDGTNLRGTTQTNLLFTEGSVLANTTITDWASLRIANPSTAATGAVITNNYAIHQTSTIQKNYFAGRVGIGTNDPGNLLDVAGDTDITGQLFVTHDANYVAKIKQTATSMSNAAYTFEIDSTSHDSNLSAAGAMSVDVDSGRAFTINGLGSVGIGTNSPSEKLSVSGNIELDDMPANGTRYLMTNETNTGTGRLNIQAGGGSAAYGGGLSLIANSHASKPGWVIAGISSGAGTTGEATEGRFVVNNHALGTGTDIFTVLRTGNVGIGVTEPGSKLEIFRAAGLSSTPQLIISTGEGSSRDYSLGTDVMAAGDFAILDGVTSTTANVRMRFVSGGTVIAFKDDNTSELGRYVSTAAGGSIKRIRMNQGGEIHFGDTSTSNPCGITEGNWNSFGDQDFMSIYARNKLQIFAYPNGSTISASFVLGTFTAVGDVVAYGSPSDKRLKENIKPIESALDKVSKLQGVTFDWKESDSILKIKKDIGFIAQDVQKVIPELVRKNEDGLLSMRHQGIAPILLEAIKELKAEIEELKKCKCDCKK